MSKYQSNKEKARALAIETQIKNSNRSMSYAEFVDHEEKFYKLGKRYGLLKEFKREGII